MNRLSDPWERPNGAFSLGPIGGIPRIEVSSHDGIVRVRLSGLHAVLRRTPRRLSWPWRRRAIAEAEAALGTLRLRGWLPEDGALQGGSAHTRIAAADWMARHRATLARGIAAMRVIGDEIPWGLLGDEAGVHLCLVADADHVLPLLSRPIS